MSESISQLNAMVDTLHNRFVSLHAGDPGITGANELTGGGYGRRLENLGPAENGTSRPAGYLEFEDLPACTVTHFGFWTLQRGGNFLGAFATHDGPVEVPAGATARIWITLHLGPEESFAAKQLADDDAEVAEILNALLS